MPTTIGTEDSLSELLRNLLLLEHDAIAAYDASIARLAEGQRRAMVEAFRRDHLDHLAALSEIARDEGLTPPGAGELKHILTAGKVAIGGLEGEEQVLTAMCCNEDETVQAYEQACANAQASPALRSLLDRALSDERQHRSWMETAAA